MVSLLLTTMLSVYCVLFFSRKISSCTCSDLGTETHSVNMSVVQTLLKDKNSFLNSLRLKLLEGAKNLNSGLGNGCNYFKKI